MELDYRGLNRESVMKSNATLKSYISDIFIFLVSSAVIICWVIPVAFVGVVSQMPYLTTLIPTISGISRLPNFIEASVATVFPTLIMTFFTTLVVSIFSILTTKKRNLTGRSQELSIQNWVFIFLYFQLFIIVTISSGFVSVIRHLFYNPIAVPMIVASDLPKASCFFFPFFLLRAMNLLSSNLLQFYEFLKEVVIFPNLIKKTPRAHHTRFSERHSNKLHFGRIYPSFSVYGSIAIVYSVISPSITVFCCLNLVVDIVAFKFTLRNTMNKKNVNETYGELYTMALRQLYAGVYALEVYMMGFLFTAKDAQDNRPCTIYGFLMMFVTAVTVYAHIYVNQRFDKQLSVIPLELFSYIDRVTSAEHLPNGLSNNGSVTRANKRLKYLHPCFQFEPQLYKVMLPQCGLVLQIVADTLNKDGISTMVGA